MLLEKDYKQIEAQGISLATIETQVETIKKGVSYANLIRPAALHDGIKTFSPTAIEAFVAGYEAQKDQYIIVKFVPASGAATRMFKFLYPFVQNFIPSKMDLETYCDQKDDSIKTFFQTLENFPFYKTVTATAKTIYPEYESLPYAQKCYTFAEIMLSKTGLNYGLLPKGLLLFHQYSDRTTTAFEEHLLEATQYASTAGIARLHFTISKQHHSFFDQKLKACLPLLEAKTSTRIKVDFSYQKISTQTIALTHDNHIFRHQNGTLVFRPAGHGALLENLNGIKADIVFLKNIDNIAVASKNKKRNHYKKYLAGVLLKFQQQSFEYLQKIDMGNISETTLLEALVFIKEYLQIPPISGFKDAPFEEKKQYLKTLLNRPIRVCGMVKNEGAPGGGPFWVKSKTGDVQLQIIEFAQIDTKNQAQKEIAQKATHFNPVDIVCGLKNYQGESFNLLDYVDTDAVFINHKEQYGTAIKTLERPGLWNGSMAYWNTIFVEVPQATFNPVKTVNDLLSPAHQGGKSVFL